MAGVWYECAVTLPPAPTAGDAPFDPELLATGRLAVELAGEVMVRMVFTAPRPVPWKFSGPSSTSEACPALAKPVRLVARRPTFKAFGRIYIS